LSRCKVWVSALFLLASGHLTSVFGSPEAVSREQDTLVFGAYAYIRSTELFKKIAPLQRSLQDLLARQGVPFRIDLRLFPSYDEAIDALVEGQVDFVRFGPVSYVRAKRQNPDLRLLAMESNNGKKTFDGVISVARDSPIRTLEDLSGKRFAFGDRRSTTGRYLAQAALVRAGIRGEDLSGYSYLGRHDKVAFAVATGNYDAGAFNENTFTRYAQSKGLRKIAAFPCATKPWVARAGMDESTFSALREALLALNDAAALQPFGRSGFLLAQDTDFDLIRQAMRLAEQFDEQSLTFAVYDSSRPSGVSQLVQPVLDQIGRKLRAEAGIQNIRLEVFGTYPEAIDALIRGDIDFGRLSPASYVLAKRANPHIRLLAREEYPGEVAAGIFVVAADSPILSLSDLAGRTLAFGNRLSIEGRLMAQAALIEAGVSGADLASYSYLGRHDRLAYLVAAGSYDAGVLPKSALNGDQIAGELRVIGEYAAPQKVWVAREGMERDLFELIRQALLHTTGDPRPDAPGIPEFSPTEDRFYARLRKAIELADTFERPP